MSRYYDPEIGQFISMDGSDYLTPDTIGGVDLYAYCNNNPIMYVDPTGHLAIITAINIFLILHGTSVAIAAPLVIGTVIGGIIGYNIAKNSSDGEANAWDLVYGTILGAAAGLAITGAGMLLVGLTVVLAKALILKVAVIGSIWISIAAVGAAAFTLGCYIFAVLNGEEPPESSSFPEPSTVPLWPPLITGF